MTILCLDNHRQPFCQLINRSVECVLAQLSPWVDQNLLQLISVWNFVTIHLLQRSSTLNSTRDLDLDCSTASFLVQWTQPHWSAAKRQCAWCERCAALRSARTRSRCSRYGELPAVNLVRVRWGRALQQMVYRHKISRSLKLVPFESVGAVSSSPSIVTIALSCIHFRDKARYWSKIMIFHTPCIRRPVKGSSSKYCHPVRYGKT